VGRSIPAMTLSRVDLPLPEGPMTAVTVPAAIEIVTSFKAGRGLPENVRVTAASCAMCVMAAG